MFQPATLLRWHRELVRRKWAAFQRRHRRGRPPLPEETKALILGMARENPRWGDRRVKGELLKLGIKVSATAIRMLLREHRISPAARRGGPTWRQFIRAHASAIVATDLFTIDTVFLQTLYVIVFIDLGTGRLLFANCTANPDSAWVTQQARNVAYEIQDLGLQVRFAIHDRDAKFTSGFDAILESEGMEVIRTPYRAPRANSHCERSIGSARREFFDFMIVAGERHLRLLLHLWLDHYNRGRPHMALDLVAPDPRPTAGAGAIVRERKLFGLTTEYSRARNSARRRPSRARALLRSPAGSSPVPRSRFQRPSPDFVRTTPGSRHCIGHAHRGPANGAQRLILVPVFLMR
jgi:putative transposase